MNLPTLPCHGPDSIPCAQGIITPLPPLPSNRIIMLTEPIQWANRRELMKQRT